MFWNNCIPFWLVTTKNFALSLFEECVYIKQERVNIHKENKSKWLNFSFSNFKIDKKNFFQTRLSFTSKTTVLSVEMWKKFSRLYWKMTISRREEALKDTITTTTRKMVDHFTTIIIKGGIFSALLLFN